MKKTGFQSILVLLCLLLQHSLYPAQEMSLADAVQNFASDKKGTRIAVFDFTNTDGTKTRYDGFIADTIIGELSRYKLTLLERKRLELLLKEQTLSQSGVIDSEKAVELGMLLPVDVLVSGSYTCFDDRLVINGRFINVSTGEIIYAFTSTLKNIPKEKDTSEKPEEQTCDAEWKAIKKALNNLRTKSSVQKAVAVAIQTPFAGKCGKIHYEVIYVFSRHDIYPEKYKRFLISTMNAIESPSKDTRTREIMRYFASDKKIDNDEWKSCVESLKRMKAFSLHVPLGYMLNNSHEDKSVVKKRADEIMRLAVEKIIGRPVSINAVDILFSMLYALKTWNLQKDMDNAEYVFSRYMHLIPDNDKYNEKGTKYLESIYYAEEKSRSTQKKIVDLIIAFFSSRNPSELLAEETADLLNSLDSRIHSSHQRDEVKKAAFKEDQSRINTSLQDLYCLALNIAINRGYTSLIEKRKLYVLTNGMQCPHAPSIAGLEADMRSRDWDRKLEAIELLSKIGKGAQPAQDTIITYLGQQGYGSKGGKLRSLCARTLGNIKTTNPKGITMLIESFPDYDQGVSHEAEEAIAKIGLPALPYLIDGLKHKHHAVRLRCAKALGNLGRRAQKAVPELEKIAAADQNPYVRKQARGAVQMIRNDY